MGGGEGVGGGDSGNEGQGQGSGSAGWGRGEGEGEISPGFEAGSKQISQGNAPGGGGEREANSYLPEPIYAPERVDPEGGEQVILPSSDQPGGLTVGEDNLAPGYLRQSTVPYVEVFREYEQTAREAIESGVVPVHFRALIREYFSSLEP